ncbi:MAG: anaerobic ribonucleoside-triphosphate reductase activating protein [Acetomicrobium sp.]|nr:anaerobic ribonucleoside-triphosphate reductase activating protein [Acetomicrobium sp.]
MGNIGEIGNYIPSSFIDWNSRVSAVIFLTGCNFRCPFCHNGLLVNEQVPALSNIKVIEHIKSRRSFLDGVVISGGEPTLDIKRLKKILFQLKEVGLPVKLDTNGSNPLALKMLIAEGLIDAVAMDIKGPWEKYDMLCGCVVDKESIKRSIDLLIPSEIEMEFRTTFVPALMDYEDLFKIESFLGGKAPWIMQCFKPENAMDEALRNTKGPSREILREKFPGAIIR